MERFFNTQGPCEPSRHYMLPPLQRLPTIRRLIDRGKYIVLHAPRQVGKTTALRALAQELNAEGRYIAAALTVETGAPFSGDIEQAERTILANWRLHLHHLPSEQQPPPWPAAEPGAGIEGALAAWAQAAPRPLVLFLDEIDALSGSLLLSVLRQLRAGYPQRPGSFPWALGLCGMRDVRDYQFDPAAPERVHSASPFNVKESLTMPLFTIEEVAALYQQHTDDTGQRFTSEAVQRAHHLSGGHPWLVNALAAYIVDDLVEDRTRPITAEHVDAARDEIILRREAHLDSLAERLREPRVRRVIEPILIGEFTAMDIMNDDLVYARDLGLIVDRPTVRIANPIYAEVIPRVLTWTMQKNLPHQTATYLRPDGSLDMVALLRAFQQFFAEHSESWLGRFDYQEAGPQLMLMAFLQKVVNGGGRIQRESALGSGRVDMLVCWHDERHALELKLWRGERTLQQGIEQLAGYLDRLGLREGFLLLFDRGGRPWADKLYETTAHGPGDQTIHVLGM